MVYSTPGDTVAATPYVPVTGSAGRVTILGLLPFHTYVITVQALGGGHRTSATWGYATGGLPPWVQAPRSFRRGHSPGATRWWRRSEIRRHRTPRSHPTVPWPSRSMRWAVCVGTAYSLSSALWSSSSRPMDTSPLAHVRLGTAPRTGARHG